MTIQGYLNTLTLMQAAKARAVLETQVRVNGGGFMTRRELIERRLASGAVVTVRNNGERVLMNPDGSFLDSRNITKTGLDYAAFTVLGSKYTLDGR